MDLSEVDGVWGAGFCEHVLRCLAEMSISFNAEACEESDGGLGCLGERVVGGDVDGGYAGLGSGWIGEELLSGRDAEKVGD